jgi:NADH dehydrogenase
VLRYYPGVPQDELRFVLVHSRDRILPELSARLADYALRTLRARGIEFLLERRVAGATAEALLLSDGGRLPTATLVWTAGNQPNPLLAGLPCERSRAGAVLVDSALRVKGFDNVWAVGDCAEIPDPDQPGKSYPPTAQHALREGKAVAANIAAALRGQPPRPFRFRTIGMLVALGHHTAAAEVWGWQFSGLLAWLMWRSIYLGKLPGLEKKLRVLLDWTIDLFFPRDIVLTAGLRVPHDPRAPRVEERQQAPSVSSPAGGPGRAP